MWDVVNGAWVLLMVAAPMIMAWRDRVRKDGE